MAEMITGPVGVETVLTQFREMMAADGYLLTWSEIKPQQVVVRISAGEGACADCLVPQPVMEAIIKKALASTTYTLDQVILPGAH